MNVKEFSIHVFHCSVIKVPVSFWQLRYFIISLLACQELFLSFFKLFFVVSLFERLPAIGCCRFAAAILDYHIFSDLSTTFLTFFIIFGSFCSILRKFVTSCFHIASAATCLLYHMLRCLSTTFFIIFWIVSTLLNYYGVFCHLSATARL